MHGETQTNGMDPVEPFDTAGRCIGGCGLNGFNHMHNFANLGYWIRQSRQRQGYAVDAVHALSAFGFTTLRLTRIEIVVASENASSRRVADKAGATFECVAPKPFAHP